MLKTYEVEDPVALLVDEIGSFEAKFKKLNLEFNEEQNKVAAKIAESLEICNSVIVVGKASVGKSTVIDIALEIMQEKKQSKKTYLNISSYDQVQILGNLDSEGIISNILSETEEPHI